MWSRDPPTCPVLSDLTVSYSFSSSTRRSRDSSCAEQSCSWSSDPPMSCVLIPPELRSKFNIARLSLPGFTNTNNRDRAERFHKVVVRSEPALKTWRVNPEVTSPKFCFVVQESGLASPCFVCIVCVFLGFVLFYLILFLFLFMLSLSRC